MPTFNIPEDISVFTSKALRDLALQAAAAYEEIVNSTTEDTVTDEQLDDMEAYSAFTTLVDDELERRTERAARFRATTADPEDEVEETDAQPEAEVAQPAAQPAQTFAPEPEVATPTLAQIAPAAPTPAVEDIPERPMFRFIAAPDSGVPAGAELDGWDGVTKAFMNRTRSHIRGGSMHHNEFASIKREFGNDVDIFENDSDEEQIRKINLVRDESRADGGSLLAGVGWCSPSETIYTTCNQVTVSGLLRVPEIGARRGGIRHNQGIQFDAIFGSGTGFNILTEEQVIADTVKTCAAVPCPPFVDDRLKVAALCLTGDILQDRAYPEFVKEFIQGAVAVQAHNVNRQIIADIVSDSTAVTLTGNQPWTSDGSVVSQVLSASNVAATDIRYRLRLDIDAVVEAVYPLWLRASMRDDWIRRNGPMDPDLTDAMIMSMFATRKIAPQWVYDWQDAFSTGASGGSPGADVPIVALPTTLSFIMFPAGTWVVARQDVIRLDTIYDSTNITTNKVTQLFVEDGFRAMRFCPISRVYTLPVCANGSTGVQRAVTCA